MNSRLSLSAVAAAAALFFAADAGAQVKSNISSDPKSSNCTENCIDAGYEWAIANTPTTEDDCAAKNEDFAAGCDHWLEEQREAAAPPPEEPATAPMPDDAATPMPDDSAAPMPDDSAAPADAGDDSATQTDDSSAPPSDDPSNPPQNQ